MKRLTAFALALVLALSLGVTASAAEDTRIAYASAQTVDIDGKPVELQAYALKDENGNPTNYVKLRDVAYVLSGTDAQFEVTWNGGVNIVTDSPYTPNGSEMSTPFSGDRRYSVSNATTYVNGKASDLEAITLTDGKGGAYTYYKLRDLGNALGFIVDWSAERGIYIEIEPKVSFVPTECEVNPNGNGSYRCVESAASHEKTGKYWLIEPEYDLRYTEQRTALSGSATIHVLTYTDEELTERYGVTFKDGWPGTAHLPDYESYHNETGNQVYHDEYGMSWAKTTCGCGTAVGWEYIGDTGKWAEAPMKCTVASDVIGTMWQWCSYRTWRSPVPGSIANLNEDCYITDEELIEHFGIPFENGRPTSMNHLPDAKTYRDETGTGVYIDEYGLEWYTISCQCGDGWGWRFTGVPNEDEFRSTDYRMRSYKATAEKVVEYGLPWWGNYMFGGMKVSPERDIGGSTWHTVISKSQPQGVYTYRNEIPDPWTADEIIQWYKDKEERIVENAAAWWSFDEFLEVLTEYLDAYNAENS